MNVILASGSPRRRELLKLVGLDPQVIIPDIAETPRTGETTEKFVQRITIAKGINVYQSRHFSSLIISADTIVRVDQQVLGKPRDPQEALAMLRRLSGRCHEVWTGIALMHRGETHFEIERTTVYFRALKDSEIRSYLDHESVLDKAGAYAIQGRAALFVERIDGCFFNVVGFPLNLFYRMAERLRLPLFSS